MAESHPPPVTATWRKSSRSKEGDCVLVAHSDNRVWIRDSKGAPGDTLGMPRAAWARFLATS